MTVAIILDGVILAHDFFRFTTVGETRTTSAGGVSVVTTLSSIDSIPSGSPSYEIKRYALAVSWPAGLMATQLLRKIFSTDPQRPGGTLDIRPYRVGPQTDIDPFASDPTRTWEGWWSDSSGNFAWTCETFLMFHTFTHKPISDMTWIQGQPVDFLVRDPTTGMILRDD